MDNFIYWGAAIVVRIIMPSIILNLYFNVLLIPKESKHLQKYFAWFFIYVCFNWNDSGSVSW